MSDAQSEPVDQGGAGESHTFQTEAKQLLHLMIHSLYSNREIFLRELISNAADAIDKLRFKSIANPELLEADSDYRIRVDFDPEAKSITVNDNGIGMTREEVIAHLGTIAKSGTAEFLAQLSGDQKKDAQLIGQFGVGFYSCFIVAEQVEVLTRGAGDSQGTRWLSAGEDSFTVQDADDLPRGTSVVLHLKSDAVEFADDYRLRTIVRKYSDHIGVPVMMVKPPEPEAEDDNKAAGASDPSDASDTSDTPEFEAVNSAQALWTRSRSEVSEDEYKQFYKHVSHDFEDPRSWSHNRVEGKLEYTSLLFLPKRAPFDLWNREAPRGLKLYVQRVFIMDDADQFLPLYLRFVKGVVDSNDLPLNVSREILQEDDRVTTIRNALTKRVLTMLSDLAKKEPEDYQAFWDEFGEVLKEGAGEDFGNRDVLLKLLRFGSTTNTDNTKNVSIESYLERKVEEQEAIYYLCAESWENAQSSPHLEIFRERGIEVLLLGDRIDEWLMSMLHEFDGTPFVDVMRGDLELPGETKDKDDTADDADKKADDAADNPLTGRIQSVLAERVEGVRVSKRLKTSPACLVLNDHALGAQMRRIMEASGQAMPEDKPYFEYNADHPLIRRLDSEADEDRFEDLINLLFDQAWLAEGRALKDAAGYVGRLNGLLLDLLQSDKAT